MPADFKAHVSRQQSPGSSIYCPAELAGGPASAGGEYSAKTLERRFADISLADAAAARQGQKNAAGAVAERIFENFVVIGPSASAAPSVLYSFPEGHDPAVQELVSFCCPFSTESPSTETVKLGSSEARHKYVAAPALAGAESWIFSLQGAGMERPLYGICLAVSGTCGLFFPCRLGRAGVPRVSHVWSAHKQVSAPDGAALSFSTGKYTTPLPACSCRCICPQDLTGLSRQQCSSPRFGTRLLHHLI
jgi:hypothetical protein